MSGDRHEPMPDVSRLPAWLWRRSPRAVRVALVLAPLAAVGLALVLAPGVRESKEERARAEREAEQRQRARRLRELRAEQRPVTGRLPAGGIEAAVLADARRRVRLGRLDGPVRRARCDLLPAAGSYACLAVTASIPASEANEAGLIGHPYRARVNRPSGRFALCKISGRAGEGAITDDPIVPVPPACGGR